MAEYTYREINEIVGEQKFYELLKNGNSQFTNFIENLEKQYESEIASIYRIMYNVANGQKISEKKFRKYHLKSTKKAFEIKTKNLRVYGIHSSKLMGKLIIIGGQKKDQNKDTRKFERIIKEVNIL